MHLLCGIAGHAEDSNAEGYVLVGEDKVEAGGMGVGVDLEAPPSLGFPPGECSVVESVAMGKL